MSAVQEEWSALREAYLSNGCVLVPNLLAPDASSIAQWANDLVFIPGVELTWEMGE